MAGTALKREKEIGVRREDSVCSTYKPGYQGLGSQSTVNLSHKHYADTYHSAHLFIGQAGELVSFRATSRSLWLGNFLGPGNLADPLHVSPSFLQH